MALRALLPRLLRVGFGKHAWGDTHPRALPRSRPCRPTLYGPTASTYLLAPGVLSIHSSGCSSRAPVTCQSQRKSRPAFRTRLIRFNSIDIKYTGRLLAEPIALRPTQPKVWVGPPYMLQRPHMFSLAYFTVIGRYGDHT